MMRFSSRLTTLPQAASALLLMTLLGSPLCGAEPAKLSVLLLGDEGHHRPADMAQILTPALAPVGIRVEFTKDVTTLTPANLARYDAVAIFRDSGDLPPKQEAALLEFVEAGKGLVAIHCASHCFRNSDRYTALVGGRFLRHDTGLFRARIIDAQHPALRGVTSFESWDETYVHNQIADDIRVLMVREEAGGYEPYTWVRQQGKGRVFYTALGHDERTWKQPGFHKLLEAGLRWAAGQTAGPAKDVQPFEYVPARVPHYLPGKAWGTTGAPIDRMQKPLSPAESMKHMHLPEGFEVQLYAAEPDIAKPIALAWDARGRLWIAETEDYPNDLQPSGRGHDRIKICEDTDGDGRADKFTVFADHLSIPTGLVFANGGVIVAQAPETLFLESSKGDDKADVRRVLFRGWGTADTHAVCSNLRPGFDNWICGTVGYSGFDGTVGGHKQKFGQGVYRFKSDGSQLEFLTSTSNNTWGLGLAETGQVFASTANNQHSVHLAIPNRYFEGVRGWFGQGSGGIEDHKKFHPITDDVRQVDVHGGFTAACGHALYTARSFPREYWDRAAFVCEPTGHLVHVDWLVPRGSGFVARDGWNILASDDAWTAPILAEMGPDGALWVIDWYNYIVQHNPTPAGFQTGKGGAYVTPLRDKTHGRIYRIVYKGAKPGKRPELDRADARELVATLGHENLWWRQTAQRLLVERGQKDVVPALIEKARDPGMDEVGLNPGAIHALWTLHGLGALDGSQPQATAAAAAALKHRSAAVRRNAVQVLPHAEESVKAIAAAELLHDPDAAVRLAALLALADMPSSETAARALAQALEADNEILQDQRLTEAATAAAAAHDGAFLPIVASRRPAAEPSPALLVLLGRVAEHYARGAPTQTAVPLLEAMAGDHPRIAEALLGGLARGWPSDKAPAAGERTDKALAGLLPRLSPAARSQLVLLAGRWGSKGLEKYAEEIAGSFRKQLRDEKQGDPARIAAAVQLVEFRRSDADAAREVIECLSPRSSPELAQGLLDAVGRSEAPAAGASLVERLPALTPRARSAALRVLLGRADWSEALLGALEKGGVQIAELSLDQKQGLAAHPNKAVAERARKLLARGGGLPDPDREKIVQALLPLTRKTGSAAAGKLVFQNHCAKCHTHGGEGGKVGPDLTGMAVHPKDHLLIDILDPSRSVEGNFRQYVAVTKAGQVVMGLLAAETKTAVELLDAEGKKHVLLRDDLDDFQASPKSLMPEGFEKQIPPDDLVNLLEFLTQRGRFLPVPLDRAATIVSTRGMFYSADADAERLIFPDWSPKTFQGVPFRLVDPQGDRVPNVILLHGPQGHFPPKMPKAVSVPVNAPAKAVHLLSGVSGWGFPLGEKGSVSLIVRLHYAGGQTEDHALRNGVHFADYIRVVDVPESKLAFRLRGQQIRYLAVLPKRSAKIERIEFVKGDDATAPVVMAVTVEARE
jgi:putative membrane-bound dehydrogenase-like protein